MTTSNLVESCPYDDTANLRQDIQSDTYADSYADVVAVSENVDSHLSRLSDIQYDRYDSPELNAATFHGEQLTKDKTRELIDVPNYNLFSNEDAYDEPDDVSISDPPCYENETVLVSNIKMAEKVRPKRTNPRDTCLPTSHSVYKENPIFQSDASSPGIGWRDSERSRFPPFDAETLETDYCTNRNAEN